MEPKRSPALQSIKKETLSTHLQIYKYIKCNPRRKVFMMALARATGLATGNARVPSVRRRIGHGENVRKH
jgi:hypothetical protein